MLAGDCERNINKFNIKFDLIYSLECFYYFNDEKLIKCFKNIKDNLSDNGKFIFQTITGDYELKGDEYIFNADIINSKGKLKNNDIIFRDRDFYLNTLKEVGFNIIGEKLVEETFFVNKEALRRELFLCMGV